MSSFCREQDLLVVSDAMPLIQKFTLSTWCRAWSVLELEYILHKMSFKIYCFAHFIVIITISSTFFIRFAFPFNSNAHVKVSVPTSAAL